MFTWLRQELRPLSRDQLMLLKARLYRRLKAYKVFTTQDHIPDWVRRQQMELLYMLMYIEERL